jgi:hypothetical protein
MVKVAVGAGVGERMAAVDVAQAANSGMSSMSIASIATRGRVARVFRVFSVCMGRLLPDKAVRTADKDNGHAVVALV